MLHGHPTRSRAINTALASAPYWLWLPFERYRQTHLTHHRDERLTDPLDDPESRYVTPEAWAALGPLMRTLVRSQGTMLGRLTIGPVLAPVQFLISEAEAIRAGDRELARIWVSHALVTVLWCVWVFVIARVPVWQYLIAVVYLATALALVRSFCEHRAHGDVGWRTAVVERSPIFGVLFLFNNLHVVHHRWPSVPWYRLPALYGRHRQAFLAANGGLVYRGYGEVLRRFAFRHHHVPVHPLGRIPAANNAASPAGGAGLVGGPRS
jgi:fatty acid desaturase